MFSYAERSGHGFMDSGASHQDVRMEADVSGGPSDHWLQMAAGERRCRTYVDHNGVSTICTPMSRAELDQAQKEDAIFPTW